MRWGTALVIVVLMLLILAAGAAQFVLKLGG